MKEQFNFDQIISQKLSDFQPATPNGAWENISQNISTNVGSSVGSSLSIKSIIGSVAVASTIAVGTLYYQSSNIPTPNNNNQAVAGLLSDGIDSDHESDSTQIIIKGDNNSTSVGSDKGDNDDDGDDQIIINSDEFGGNDSIFISTDSLDGLYGGPGSRKKIGENDDDDDSGDDLTAGNDSESSMANNSGDTPELAIATSISEGVAPLEVDLALNKDVARAKWTINEIGFESYSKEASVTIEKPGDYLVNVITEDENGNFESSVTWITVSPETNVDNDMRSGEYEIQLANFFTPNDDGFNDTYGLSDQDINNITDYEMTILNLNGRMVFRSSDPNERWDGNMKDGSIAQNGVYFVVVKYSNEDHLLQPVKKMTITLRR